MSSLLVFDALQTQKLHHLSLLFSTHHLALNMLTTSHLQSLQKIIISNLKIILYQPNKVVFKVVVTLFRPTTCQVALAVLHALADKVGNVPQTIDWLYPPRHTPSEVRLFLLPKLCQWVDYRQVDILLF